MTEQYQYKLKVATNFCAEYYKLYVKEPEKLLSFYNPQAQYSHDTKWDFSAPSRSSSSVRGPAQIEQHLQKLSRGTSRVIINTIEPKTSTDERTIQFLVVGKQIPKEGTKPTICFKHLLELRQHRERNNCFSIYSDIWRVDHEATSNEAALEAALKAAKKTAAEKPPLPTPAPKKNDTLSPPALPAPPAPSAGLVWSEETPPLFAQKAPAVPPALTLNEEASPPKESEPVEEAAPQPEPEVPAAAAQEEPEPEAAAFKPETPPAEEKADTPENDKEEAKPKEEEKKPTAPKSWADLAGKNMTPKTTSNNKNIVEKSVPVPKKEREEKKKEADEKKAGKDKDKRAKDEKEKKDKDEPKKEKDESKKEKDEPKKEKDESKKEKEEKEEPKKEAPAPIKAPPPAAWGAKTQSFADRLASKATGTPAATSRGTVVAAGSAKAAVAPTSPTPTTKDAAKDAANKPKDEKKEEKRGGRSSEGLAAAVNHYHVFIKGLHASVTESQIIDGFAKIAPLKSGVKIESKTIKEEKDGQTIDRIRTFAFVNLDCDDAERPKYIEAMRKSRPRIGGAGSAGSVAYCDEVREKAAFVVQPASNSKK